MDLSGSHELAYCNLSPPEGKIRLAWCLSMQMPTCVRITISEGLTKACPFGVCGDTTLLLSPLLLVDLLSS